MAKLATCPGCTSQLALPEEATLSDRARCPRCGADFLLMESVQFSIPNAEILPPELRAEVELPGTVGPDSYLDSTNSGEYFSEPIAHVSPSEPETFGQETFEPEPLPASATLSDWEARLKRAISPKPDLDSEVVERHVPRSIDSPDSTLFSPPTDSSTKHVAVPDDDDFSISATDFKPQSDFSSQPDTDEWAVEDEYELDSRPAAEARTSFDSFDEEVLVDVPNDMDKDITVEVNTGFAPLNRRKRSTLRTLASASLGVIGIPLGLYVLLWLRGPAGDVLNLSQYVPPFMLPASFAQNERTERPAPGINEPNAATTNEAATALLADDTDEVLSATDLAEAEIAEEEPEVRNDPEVAPASAIEPLYRGPKFSLVDHNEFAELLIAAEQAAPQLAEGDLNSKQSVAKKGQAYMTLARLADKCSYFDQPGLDLDQSARAALAKQLLRMTLRKEDVKRDLPQIALRWWQYPERPSPGILLVGTIERLQASDAGTTAFVSLGVDGVAPAIPVLLPTTDLQEGAIIGVAGSIMADPQEQMGSNELLTGPIVVSYYSFPLEPFDDQQQTTPANHETSSPLGQQ